MYIQMVSLYHNSSVWLGTHDASSWDRHPSNFTLKLVSYHSATDDTCQLGKYMAFCTRFRLFTLCLTGYQCAQFIRKAFH